MRDKYLDNARELKKNPIEPESDGDTVTKRLLEIMEDLEIRGREETVQTITFF